MKIAAYVTGVSRPREDNPLPLDHPGVGGTPHRVVSLQVEVLDETGELGEEYLDALVTGVGPACQQAVELLMVPHLGTET